MDVSLTASKFSIAFCPPRQIYSRTSGQYSTQPPATHVATSQVNRRRRANEIQSENLVCPKRQLRVQSVILFEGGYCQYYRLLLVTRFQSFPIQQAFLKRLENVKGRAVAKPSLPPKSPARAAQGKDKQSAPKLLQPEWRS